MSEWFTLTELDWSAPVDISLMELSGTTRSCTAAGVERLVSSRKKQYGYVQPVNTSFLARVPWRDMLGTFTPRGRALFAHVGTSFVEGQVTARQNTNVERSASFSGSVAAMPSSPTLMRTMPETVIRHTRTTVPMRTVRDCSQAFDRLSGTTGRVMANTVLCAMSQ